MKKLLPVVIALLILLTACSTSDDNNVVPPTAPSPTLSAMKKVTSEVKQPTFCVLIDDYLTVVDPWVTSNGVESLFECQYSEFDVDTTKGYSFSPALGLDICLYTPIKNEEINQIVCRLDTDAADDKTQKAFFNLTQATIYGLDYEIAESILEKLNLDNISDGEENVYDSTNAGYVFGVDANIIQLFIIAK